MPVAACPVNHRQADEYDVQEKRMAATMARSDAHPDPGEEVKAMDDVDANVCSRSITDASGRKERVGNHE